MDKIISDFNQPPKTEQQLLQNAEQLAGMTFQQVAKQLALNVPQDQKRHKGWVGELAEKFLGATASTLAEPDFQHIGVELKTIPLNKHGRPAESTYVSTVPMTNIAGLRWQDSIVCKKLSRVLWLPIEADKVIAMDARRFGSATLWSPTPTQEAMLRADWEELMEMIATGEIDKISSTHGQHLQIRPKAANARSLGRAHTADGDPTSTLPRGFYLRTSFTKTIFE